MIYGPIQDSALFLTVNISSDFMYRMLDKPTNAQ